MASSPRTGRSSAAHRRARWSARVLVVLVIAAVAVGLDVAGAGRSDHLDASSRRRRSPTAGRHIRDLYIIVFAIAAVIFFVVEGLIVWSVIRYRRKPGDDELPPQTHGNAIAEIVWTVVPTLIVAFMFVISWQTLNTVEAISAAAPDRRSARSAGQFQWTFDYLPGRLDPTVGRTPEPLYTQTSARGARRRPRPAGRADRPAVP